MRVEGGGLNGDTRHDTEYVDILARAVDINAGVWAKARLSVVTGRNRIGADGTTATPLADDGSTKPELAIDMGQMGGMYNGQIRMIGTEAGVGVRNQGGHLQTGKTLTISSEGKLSWQSAAQEAVTEAGGDIRLTARNDIDHHGKLHSGGTLVIESRVGKLSQSGTLAATGDVRLSANSGIESHGHLLAGSDANCQIVCDADLRLDSQGDIRASGSLLGKKDVTLVGHRVDISGAQLAANHTTLVAREDGVALRQSQVDSGQFTLNKVGDVDAQQAQVKAGRWEVNTTTCTTKRLSGHRQAAARATFTLTGKLDNTDGSIEAHSLALTSGALTNQHGRLVALNDSAQYWRVSGILDNNSGELGSNGDFQLDSDRLNNQGCTVKTQAALTLYASGDINNTQGKVITQRDANLTAQQALSNADGLLEAGGTLSMRTDGDWDNRDGTTQGGHQVTVATHTLNNASSWLQSGGDLTLDSTGDISNQRGKLTAQHTLDIKGATTGLFDNDGGSLQSGGPLSLHGGRLTNRQSGLVLSQQALSLILADDWATWTCNSPGSWITPMATSSASQRKHSKHKRSTTSSAGWAAFATSEHFDNIWGSVQGQQGVQLAATWLHNAKGALQSAARLALRVAQDIDNQNKIAAQGPLAVQGTTPDATTGRINNAGGTIDGQQNGWRYAFSAG